MIPKWLAGKELTPKDKSLIQEKTAAKKFGGRTTYASGALFFDKGDCVFDKLRVECKRTDKEGIYIEKAWLDKLKRETHPREFYAMEVEVKDERIYLIPESEFKFLKWIINASAEEIIESLKEESL